MGNYKINIKQSVMYILTFLISKVGFLGINPFGIAIFMALYVEGRSNIIVFILCILGMAISFSVIETIKCSLVILISIIISKLLENSFRIGTFFVAIVSSMTVLVINLIMFFTSQNVNNSKDILHIIIEAVMIFSSVFVFQKGVYALKTYSYGKIFDNQEIVSISIIIGILLFSIPYNKNMVFAVLEMLVYSIVFYGSYCYGAREGAMLGAICGSILAYRLEKPEVIGVIALIGLCTGIFREMGKLFCIIGAICSTLLLGTIYAEFLFEVNNIKGFVSAMLIFLFLPKKFLKPLWNNKQLEQNELIKDEIRQTTKLRLMEYSDAFRNLKKSFETDTEDKNMLTNQDVMQLFNGISDRICANCLNCSTCWKDEFYDTYQAGYAILNAMEQKGNVEKEDIPKNFLMRCYHLDEFLNEASRGLEVANLKLFYRNQILEGREAVACQLGEVATILDEFSTTLYDKVEKGSAYEGVLRIRLERYNINVKKLVIVKRTDGKDEVYLTARTRRGNFTTSKEIAKIISEVFGKKMKSLERNKVVVGKEYGVYIFVEESRLKFLYGVASAIKDNENISGDNYAIFELQNEKMAIVLSDGMGSGMLANAESSSVIDMLQKLLEAGFSEKSAIKLINSVLFLKTNQENFSTLDLSIIDLFTGNLKCVKIGATKTFIKREDRITVIDSNSLPIGCMNTIDIKEKNDKVCSGDIIIMLTDGIIDAIESEDKERFIVEVLKRINTKRPQEFAQIFLDEVSEEIKKDDMTVIVGIVEEN